MAHFRHLVGANVERAGGQLFAFVSGLFLYWNQARYLRSSCVPPTLYLASLRRYREETMQNVRPFRRPNEGLNLAGNNPEAEPEAERRREPRSDVDLAVTVWGIDTRGDRFLQPARARNISLSGALLSGLDADLRSGDVIGILYAGKKARYRVVWVRESANGLKVQAAIHRIAPDECPWKELLPEERASNPQPVIHPPSAGQ